jgi:hypothetical protein
MSLLDEVMEGLKEKEIVTAETKTTTEPPKNEKAMHQYADSFNTKYGNKKT